MLVVIGQTQQLFYENYTRKILKKEFQIKKIVEKQKLLRN